MINRIVVGSRESRLAVIQSELVMEQLRAVCPDTEIVLRTMKTTGDIFLDKTLDKIGGKGLFLKELEQSLLREEIDIAVHSLKDMPMEQPEGLPVLAYSEREDARDVLILPKGTRRLEMDKPIGCSSFRRRLQLERIFPGTEVKPIRGNVLTRLEKLDRGEYGGLVLAAAGICRLGLESRIARYFSVDEILPAAGQGIMAVQGREGMAEEIWRRINHRDTEYIALCERSFVRTLNGGCSSPVAAHAVIDGGKMYVTGLYYDEESGGYLTGTMSGDAEAADNLGRMLAEELRRRWNDNRR